MGGSAGSWSVLHHMLAPGSRGLFSKAIGQSGAFVGGEALKPESTEVEAEKGLAFAQSANCDSPDIDMLTCLQSLSEIDIMAIPTLPRGMIDNLY